MEGHKTVIKIITPNCFMATLDLKDAYFLVSINTHHRKFLRFKFNGTLYQYNCMPFGISCAPLIFTKLLKPVLTYLRGQGFISTLYLDDFLLLGHSYQECLKNVTATIEILSKLGFIINYDKSNLEPKQAITYLGFIYNSKDMSISLPQNKVTYILALINKILFTKSCKIRELAKLIGTLISACPAVKYGFLYTKLLERHKFLTLLNGNYDTKISIPLALHTDLNWWLNTLPIAKNSIRMDNYTLEIFSDASLTGWGIYCAGTRSRGLWSTSEKENHINYLELLAAYFGLKCFAKDLRDCNILCRIDNTTAIAYINRMGSIQYPHLNNLTKNIWEWCQERNLFIFASYIKSAENTIADCESRHLDIHTEWKLNDSAYQEILVRLGNPDIDFFASRNNNKCKKFVSWSRDPDAFAIDAFTINWSNYFFYAFPPFSIILRTLKKIIDDRARGILVVPYWPAQPWFPIFISLLKSQYIVFKPAKNLLSVDRIPHPLWERLTLVAGVLSWMHSD